MKRVATGARWFAVTIGIVALTSVTVDATLGGKGLSQSALGILATTLSDQTKGGCPSGTTRLGGDFRDVCVDMFEASPSAECPKASVQNANDTRANMLDQRCKVASREGATPWTFVTLHQAQELCAREGKRLLSNGEWYRASVGTPDTEQHTCNVSSSELRPTGSHEMCLSGVGAADMIGNAWEWVDGQVENNTYTSRTLPESGYVTDADQDGFALRTAQEPDPAYYADYFWVADTGIFGVLRGGFYNSEEDGGIYSIQAKTPLSFAGNAVGFRCALDLGT